MRNIADIPLAVENLATERASRKRDEARAGKDPIAKLHIIDPTSIFTAFMSSDVGQVLLLRSTAFSACQRFATLEICPSKIRIPGFRGPKALKPCRFCHYGRYHHQAEQWTYGSQWGLSEEQPALVDISPALDPILSRPPGPAHSEYHTVPC